MLQCHRKRRKREIVILDKPVKALFPFNLEMIRMAHHCHTPAYNRKVARASQDILCFYFFRDGRRDSKTLACMAKMKRRRTNMMGGCGSGAGQTHK